MQGVLQLEVEWSSDFLGTAVFIIKKTSRFDVGS